MPEVKEVPAGLRPFIWHGLDLPGRSGDTQALGECPSCGKGKFHVNREVGLWDCKSCGIGGNPVEFLRWLWHTSEKATSNYRELLRDRGLRYQDTLERWGAVKSVLTGEWLLPGYTADGRIVQLYRYTLMGGRKVLIATPTLHHGMLGLAAYDPDRPIVYVCEGPWDGMVLSEVLESEGIVDVSVVAVPSCSVMFESWRPLFAGKEIALLYDNDYPKEANGGKSVPAGHAGMRKATGVLAGCNPPPKQVQYIHWGEGGYDSSLPDGYDVREHLVGEERGKQVQSLLARLRPVPEEWLKVEPKGGSELQPLPCKEWRVLSMAWHRAMRWTEGLDRALSVMLACCTSTKALGDQLWIKVISPPSGGKSTLCEALSVNKEYVLAKSTIRGFHSGYMTDREGAEDNSLVALLYDKTLVTKDGDTLLQAPNRDQILSEARDLYDSTSRTHYRNKASRDYQGVRMTWILCGTSSLRQLDTSELGERFLDCVIMEGIDDELEDEILLRVANRAEHNLSYEANGQAESRHDPDLTKAMRLTGGYVGYLRENAFRLLPRISMGDGALRQCIRLGKFVAYMRARPSRKQDEEEGREFAARLVSQIVRLAKCLAVVLNRDFVDGEVMRRVTRVASDTARGRTLEIVKGLYELEPDQGASLRWLAVRCNSTDDRKRTMLGFLKRIGVVEKFQAKSRAGVSTNWLWRLTPRLRKLYGEITSVELEGEE